MEETKFGNPNVEKYSSSINAFFLIIKVAFFFTLANEVCKMKGGVYIEGDIYEDHDYRT